MATIKDISQLANVSIASVSQVLNGNYNNVSNDTKERILKVAKDLKYRPNRLARGLVKNETSIIGLIVPDISNMYYAEIVKGVEEEAGKNAYQVILCNTSEDHRIERKQVNMLLEYNATGLIICGSEGYDLHSIELLQMHNIPLVTLDRKVDFGVTFDSNSLQGSLLSAAYLIEMGHTKIGFIGGGLGNTSPCGRRMGFLQALEKFDIPQRNSLYKIGHYNIKTGYQCTKQLLEDKEDFTALSCANDLIAFGAIKAIHEHGLRIPADLSLVGYDDIFLASFFEPELTTIRQDSYTLGKDMVTELIQIISDGDNKKKTRYIEPELIVRKSVRRLKA